MTQDTSPAIVHRPWYSRIGPGLITACVVIGPGSIMTSSTIGAGRGYSMLWVVIISVAFMLAYMSLGAKLGAVAAESPGELIRRKAGRWLSVAVGVGVFFIAAAYQSGNNIGVAAAFEAFIDNRMIVAALVVLFNAFAISFLFAFKDMYRMLERLMMGFVALMLASFAINLFRLKPNLGDMLKGFVPTTDMSGDMVTVVGLVGTTFVISGAFYQAYLVRQKGWKVDDLSNGLVDARVGSVIMFLITVMLMSTAAAAFAGRTDVVLESPVDVAEGLKATFGSSAKIIFCLGLFSAAYSSFLVNSMVGGFMASDGLGWGSKPSDLGPKLLTTAGLLTGMAVGLAVMIFDFDRAPTIIAAQAVTVVAAPLVAGVLLWLTSSRDVMGEHVNGPVMTTFAGLGLVMLIVMAGKTAIYDLPAKVEAYRASTATTGEADTADAKIPAAVGGAEVSE
ncbi:Nramp family divalent metal transporter [Fuerstiella marisgermanici]|uniref:Divalent metal cation transporter MntH n=1 Tax=Fuerstiella marisgermanici TaxID=1891926 RepID=A0A1P8WJ64_9PLAN|nr:Nramp family divalent metal transporter [Fuerstiella marisgermanici]APZ94102.1 Divalent metal cation transporter MntH [Fuerstiella marisgermanici]